jgi:hypothetical protein
MGAQTGSLHKHVAAQRLAKLFLALEESKNTCLAGAADFL